MLEADSHDTRSQTPTFNAPPVVEVTSALEWRSSVADLLTCQAALEAVRRGIEVTIIADLGFNDECGHTHCLTLASH